MVTETFTLINAVKKMYPVMQFFKDRYFPDGRNYYSEKALIETKKEGKKVAPFVVPVVNGIAIESEGYRGYEVDAPYIAPKMPITPRDLEKKAFGESPDTNRSPADRENEVESEHLDTLRKSIMRRKELMCTELITTGKISMTHYATAKDAANDTNGQYKELRYFDTLFENKYWLNKEFTSMTAEERIQFFYKVANILSERGVTATDIVMTGDVSMLLMTDKDFLEFYNLRRADFGDIKPIQTPDGVTNNGAINVNGVIFTMFTYNAQYTDLDGTTKPFLPKGTIAFLHPNIGETVYAQVTLVNKGSGMHSYAESIVPRLYEDESNNLIEVQTFSRPVPYPYDWESWIVANIEDQVLLSETEIDAFTTKAEIIAYGEAIGMTTLSDSSTVAELKAAVKAYQAELLGGDDV